MKLPAYFNQSFLREKITSPPPQIPPHFLHQGSFQNRKCNEPCYFFSLNLLRNISETCLHLEIAFQTIPLCIKQYSKQTMSSETSQPAVFIMATFQVITSICFLAFWFVVENMKKAPNWLEFNCFRWWFVQKHHLLSIFSPLTS